MKLYLSSYKFGDHPEELMTLANENKKVVVIMNAVDHVENDYRPTRLQSQIEQFTSWGFQAEELDLRNYFGKEDSLKDYLDGIGMVWINGGNAFVLKRAFEQSGFDKLILDLVKSEKIVYAGFSAAICVVVPTLHGAEMVDDPNVVPSGYKKDFSWDGLGLLDYNVAVHYQSGHQESDDIEKEIAYYIEHNIPYKTLKDGEVIIVNGAEERLVTS